VPTFRAKLKEQLDALEFLLIDQSFEAYADKGLNAPQQLRTFLEALLQQLARQASVSACQLPGLQVAGAHP